MTNERRIHLCNLNKFTEKLLRCPAMHWLPRELQKLTPDKLEDFGIELKNSITTKDMQNADDSGRKLLNDVFLHIQEKDNYSQDKQGLALPEYAFFMRVWAPCWLYHREYPTTIFRQARNGHVKSICKLALLDKTIIYEPKITKFILHLHENNKLNSFNQIMQAVMSVPEKRSIKSIKYTLAAIIQNLSPDSGKPTAPDIRKYYDAIDSDCTGGKTLRDDHLPLSDETFSKALQRERKRHKAPKLNP